MNASNLLELAAKVFVNQNQEAQKEAKGKMRKENRSPGSNNKWMERVEFCSEQRLRKK
jgi:hypothetical protein